MQTRAERAQAEADVVKSGRFRAGNIILTQATFIREELAKLKADEDDEEDAEDASEEDEDYEGSSSEEEEEEDDSYECEEEDSSDDNSEMWVCRVVDTTGESNWWAFRAVRKNREQFFEMMMELEQLKIEAQAADQLDKLAEVCRRRRPAACVRLKLISCFIAVEWSMQRSWFGARWLCQALKKDESKRLKAFENKLKHRSEEYSENDGTKDKWVPISASQSSLRPVVAHVQSPCPD